MWLSDMTADALVPGMIDHVKGTLVEATRQHVLDAMGAASAPPGTEGEMASAIDRWIADVSPASVARCLDRLDDETARSPLDVEVALHALRSGVNPVALLLLHRTCDAPINVDMVEITPDNFACVQTTVWTHRDDRIEIMVPLSADVYLTGRRLVVRARIAETALVAATGRPASVIVDHPLLEGRTVRSAGPPLGVFQDILLEPVARGTWEDLRTRWRAGESRP